MARRVVLFAPPGAIRRTPQGVLSGAPRSAPMWVVCLAAGAAVLAVRGPLMGWTARAADGAAQSRAAGVPKWVSRLQDPDRVVREEAARALADTPIAGAYDALVAALNDAHTEVRQESARALGHLGDRRAVPALLQALANKPRFETEAIVRALARLRDPAALEPLLGLLQHDDFQVRGTVAKELVVFRGPRVNEALLAVLGDPGGRLISEVARSLASLKETRAVPHLIEYLRHEDDNVRWEAAVDLGAFADPRAVEPLIGLLTDPKPSVRQRAAESLGRIGDSRAADALRTRLADAKEHEDVRRAAAVALGRVGDESALDALRAEASRSDPRMRQAAEDAIADIRLGAWRAWRTSGENAMLEVARAALGGGQAPSQLAAVRALAEARSQPAFVLLTDALRHGDPPLRVELAQAIGGFEGTAAADTLASLLQDADDAVRWTAAELLAERADGRAVEALTVFAAHQRDERRSWKAAWYLGRLGDTRAVPALAAMMSAGDRKLRQAAAAALATCADERALDPLLAALGGERAGDRAVVVTALGRIDDLRAVAALERALADEDLQVRWRAAHALARLGWSPPSEPLRVRYVLASGQADDAGVEVPRAKRIGGTDRLEGPFTLTMPVLATLSVGVDAEWPVVVWLHSIEFQQVGDEVRAVLQVGERSWPASKWRIRVELQRADGTIVASAEHTFAITVFRSGPSVMATAARPMPLSFGHVVDLASVKQFALTVELVECEKR